MIKTFPPTNNTERYLAAILDVQQGMALALAKIAAGMTRLVEVQGGTDSRVEQIRDLIEKAADGQPLATRPLWSPYSAEFTPIPVDVGEVAARL